MRETLKYATAAEKTRQTASTPSLFARACAFASRICALLSAAAQPPNRRTRLTLEPLEDRTVPSGTEIIETPAPAYGDPLFLEQQEQEIQVQWGPIAAEHTQLRTTVEEIHDAIAGRQAVADEFFGKIQQVEAELQALGDDITAQNRIIEGFQRDYDAAVDAMARFNAQIAEREGTLGGLQDQKVQLTLALEQNASDQAWQTQRQGDAQATIDRAAAEEAKEATRGTATVTIEGKGNATTFTVSSREIPMGVELKLSHDGGHQEYIALPEGSGALTVRVPYTESFKKLLVDLVWGSNRSAVISTDRMDFYVYKGALWSSADKTDDYPEVKPDPLLLVSDTEKQQAIETVEDARQRLSELETQKGVTEADLQWVEGEIEKISKEISDLQAQRSAEQARLPMLAQQISDAQAFKGALEHQKTDLSKQKADLEQQMGSVAELEALLTRRNDLDAQIAPLQDAIAQTQGSLDGKREDRAALAGNIASLQEQLAAKQAEKDQLNAKVRAINGEIALLDSHIALQQAVIDANQAVLARAAAEREAEAARPAASYAVSAAKYGKTITVHTDNMLAGYGARLLDQVGAVRAEAAFPVGAGDTVLAFSPPSSGYPEWRVQLIDARTGESIASDTVVKVFRSGVYRAVSTGTITIPKDRVKPDPESFVSPEEEVEAQMAVGDAQKAKENLEAQSAPLAADLADLKQQCVQVQQTMDGLNLDIGNKEDALAIVDAEIGRLQGELGVLQADLEGLWSQRASIDALMEERQEEAMSLEQAQDRLAEISGRYAELQGQLAGIQATLSTSEPLLHLISEPWHGITSMSGVTKQGFLERYWARDPVLQKRTELLAAVDSWMAASGERLKNYASGMAQSHALLARYSSEQELLALEKQGLKPSVHASTSPDAVKLDYTHFPTGLAFHFTFNGNDITTPAAVAGTGTFVMELPPDIRTVGGTYDMNVILTLNAVRVGSPIEFTYRDGRIVSGIHNGADQTLDLLPEPGQRLTEEQATQAQSDHDAFRKALTIEEDWHEQYEDVSKARSAMHRERIPYDRFHVDAEFVEGNALKITVRFSSLSDQSVIAIKDGPWKYVDHPGGTAEGFVTLTYNQSTGHPLDVEFWSGPQASEHRATVRVRYDQDAGTAEVLTPQRDWHDLEVGRLAEYPLKPELKVVKLSGPTAVVHVQSPFDRSTVFFDGGDGYLSNQTLTHEGGTRFHLSEITINADRPSGKYTIGLTSDGQTRLQNLEVYWDRDARTLTLADPSGQWSPQHYLASVSEMANALQTTGDLAGDALIALQQEAMEIAKAQEASSMFEKLQYLDTIDVSGTALDALQGAQLFSSSTYYIDANKELMNILRNSVYGQYFQGGGPFGDTIHKEARTIASNALAAYANAVGNVLEAAVQFCIDLRTGVPQTQAKGAFEAAREREMTTPDFREASADFYDLAMPAVEDLLKEGGRLSQAEIDRLMNNQAKAASIRMQQGNLPALTAEQANAKEGLRQATHEFFTTLNARLREVARQDNVDEDAQARLARLNHRIGNIVATSSDPRIVAIRNAEKQDQARGTVVAAVFDEFARVTLAGGKETSFSEMFNYLRGTIDVAITSVENRIAFDRAVGGGEVTGETYEKVQGGEVAGATVLGEGAGPDGSEMVVAQTGADVIMIFPKILVASAGSVEIAYEPPQRFALDDAFSLYAALSPSVGAPLGSGAGAYLNSLTPGRKQALFAAIDEATDRIGLDSAEVFIGSSGGEQLVFIKEKMKGSVVQGLLSGGKNLGSALRREALKEGIQSVHFMIRGAALVQNGVEKLENTAEDIAYMIQKEVLDTLVPLQLAREAKTAQERHDILINKKFMEYTPPKEGKGGPLVVIVNGHLQEIGIDDEARSLEEREAGMEYMTDYFQGDKVGREVLHFRVGNARLPYFRDTKLLYELTEQVLLDRLNGEGMFAESALVTRVAFAGYSWGGGTVSNLAHALDSEKRFELHQNIPVSMVLIDAVQMGYSNLAEPVDTRPPVEFLFNRYQDHDVPTAEALTIHMERLISLPDDVSGERARAVAEVLIAIHRLMNPGEELRGVGFGYEGDDEESASYKENHFTIDDPSTNDYDNGNPQTEELLITEAIKFIEKNFNNSSQ